MMGPTFWEILDKAIPKNARCSCGAGWGWLQLLQATGPYVRLEFWTTEHCGKQVTRVHIGGALYASLRMLAESAPQRSPWT
eukprot:5604800-Amphidinium_carterae.1